MVRRALVACLKFPQWQQYLAGPNVYTSMDAALSTLALAERDDAITQTVLRERARLRNFIRRRIADPGEAEDILQDVLFEFLQACRLPEPIEQVGAWLFRVARNQIIDRFRKKRETLLADFDVDAGDGDARWLPQLLAAADEGPEALYARKRLIAAISQALADLPTEQRDVFLDHEIEGRSFKQISAAHGVPVNTLLARKHQAVRRLRTALRTVHDEFDQ